jgi:dTDP-4-dehydrorhamnose 3,5-epimerase-like enzyme
MYRDPSDRPSPATTLKELVVSIPFQRFTDARGSLLSLEWEQLPFVPRRIFTVSDVPRGTVRGKHGHKTGTQLLAAIQGEIEVMLKHGGDEQIIILTPDKPALLVRPGVWFSQTYLTKGAVLLVLASESYDADAMFEAMEDA